jgi:SHS2 domain-containing protein
MSTSRHRGDSCEVKASSELLSHTAEVKLRVRAPSFGDLASEAGRALGTLELGGGRSSELGPWRELEVHATDREALLVDWLNELIYRAETERWVPMELEARSATDTALAMRGRGVTAEETPARVKAATFHGLKITAVPGGLEADIVFDV